MNNANARECLGKLYEVAERLDFKPFLCAGTALSAYRDNRFNDNDRDIDIALFESVKHIRIYINELIKVGFTYKQGFGSEEHGLQEVLIWGDLTVDIHKLYCGKRYWICAWDGGEFEMENGWERCRMVKFSWTPFKIKPQLFEGVKIYMPSNCGLYLAEQYNTWNVPVNACDWHFAKSAFNSKYTDIVMNRRTTWSLD